MKKICVNLLAYNDKLTGTGYFIKRMLGELQKLDTINNYELIVPSHIHKPEKLFGINAHNFRFKIVKNLDRKLKRIFFEQIVLPLKFSNCYDIFFSPLTALPFFGFKRCFLICTIHDLIPFIIDDKYSGIQKYYIKLISKISANRADKIITVSKNSKKDISDILKINESKINVIYNFIENNFSSEQNIKTRKPYFIFVGNIQPGKNIERLLKAFNIFRNEHPEYRLLLIGKLGWNFQEILDLHKALDLGESVEFSGYLPEKEVIKHFNEAQALVYPSLYEGFGIPPLEAIYYNCPIIVSDIASLPEVAGKAGIYVDPYSESSIVGGMKQVLDERIVTDKFKYFNIQLEKFKPEEQAAKLLKIFEDVG